MDAAVMSERVCAHALRVAREKGWQVQATDCAITNFPAPLGAHTLTQVIYWEVKVKLRASLNTHRPLARDGQLAGIVRISGGTLLDTPTESPDALKARLRADGYS
jgi:hypothetical protein